MVIKIKGIKDSQKQQLVKEIAEWSLKKLLNTKDDYRDPPLKLTITFKECDTAALTVNHDWDLLYPRRFEIIINSRQDTMDAILAVAHEMVHVKQWISGEFHHDRINDEYFWQGKIVEFDPDSPSHWENEYYDLPWEIEALGREHGLVVQWMHHKNLHGNLPDWYRQ